METIFAILFACLGAIFGSFAGVIAERAHTGQSWIGGRSRCNSCARVLGGLDMVPILSWLFTRGKCRTCRARIGNAYPIAELCLAVLFALSYARLGLSYALIPLLIALFILTALVLYDLRHMIVPWAFSSAFVLAAFLYALFSAPDADALFRTILTALAIGGILLLFYVLSRGRLMGLGDAPVAFGLSLIAGMLAPSGLIYSFWVGAAIGIVVLFRHPKGHRMGIEVPFVPFLAIGFLLAYFSGWNLLPLIGLS